MTNGWLYAIFLAVLVASLIAVRSSRRKGMQTTLKQKIEAGATIVDVRSHEEFRAGAFPGAVNIPVQEIAQRLDAIPRNRPVVLYCASGVRSARAAGILRQAGFTDVVSAGGIDDMPR